MNQSTHEKVTAVVDAIKILSSANQVVSTEKLCDIFKINKRTLVRYINIARTKINQPISSSRSLSGGYWYDSNKFVSPIKSNLVTSIKLINKIEGNEGMRDVFKKVNAIQNKSQMRLDIWW